LIVSEDVLTASKAEAGTCFNRSSSASGQRVPALP
jgi:hypothetical protein